MKSREDYMQYLNARGIEYDKNATDEELMKLVSERIQKEAQTS